MTNPIVVMSEPMRDVLLQCVKFAIQKNAWISCIDYDNDEEVCMEDAERFLRDL